MASRKEYEVLFQLNAQLDGNYGNTFKSAQAAVTAMQKEIQALSSTQSDITAYQKQQGAVEATRVKLENLQKQYDLIQREIQETETSTAGLEREKLKLAQRIADTTNSLDRQSQKLGRLSTSLQDAGIDTNNLERESAELSTKLGELRTEQEKAAEAAEDFGSSGVQAFEAIQQAIVAAGITKALHEIYGAYKECVSIAGNFEEAMSTVAALSGASADEMAALSDEAKALGAATKFTAQEAAEAMSYMGMAGWSASEMLSGMDGVLQLAAASGEDLAMVSDIVTDNLSAFGLTAADTAHFSDVLAAAATNSNTNVAIMGETFKMSASVAGALGYKVEDVAVAVGLMANSGIKGSIAGTALKNTFNGLLEGVTLTSDSFGEYEYSAVRADGTMKSFSDTIDELRGYFDQMTEAERVNNAMTIAGQRGYNGLLAILNATNEDYISLTASINECTGAASRMAAIKLDNMNGELTLMNSAWDALKTTLGEQFISVMRNLYAILTEVFQQLNSFVEKNPALVKAVAAFVAVIGTATAALTAYAAAAKIIQVLDLAALFTGPAGAIIAVTAGVAALVAGFVRLASSADDAVPSVKELTTAAQDMRDALAESNAVFDETVTSTQATANVADHYISRLEELEAAEGENVRQSQEYQDVLTLLCRAVPELSGHIDLQTYRINGGTEALREQTDAWKENAEEKARQEYLNSLYDDYNAVMAEAAENELKLTESNIQLKTAEAARSEALERMRTLYQEAKDAASAYNQENHTWKGTTDFLSKEYYDLNESLKGLNSQVWTAEKSAKQYQVALDGDAEAVAAAETAIDSAKEAYRELAGITAESEAATAEDAQQMRELETEVDGVTETMGALSEAYTSAYNAAYTSVTGQYALWDQAEKVVATSAWSINSALESQVTYWQNYNSNLEALGGRTSDIEGLNEMIASFADGSKESVNAIAGMAGASDDELRKMVANWQAVQKEQETVSDSIADLASDFSKAMDETGQALAKQVEDMDMSTEAAISGRATIEGFIKGTDSMLPAVREKYLDVAQAAMDALNSGNHQRASGNKNSLTHYTPEEQYASGTGSAEPGVALVGENGPELVYFQGGEQVLTAAETVAMQSKYPQSELLAIALAPQMMAQLHLMDKLWGALPGYASGTPSAASGLAVVGEYGPELVRLAGEEQGMTLAETAALAKTSLKEVDQSSLRIEAQQDSGGLATEYHSGPGDSIVITVAPTYHISSFSDTSELQAVLQEHDTELRDLILQVMEEYQMDLARRTYR